MAWVLVFKFTTCISARIYVSLHFKKSFITHLPKPFAGYYTYAIDERWGLHTWKDFFVFCYSALFGMLTHVIWDAFTHNTGYFVMKITFLQRELHSIPVYKYMQHGSTCVGLLLLLYVLWKYKDETGKDMIIASEKGSIGFRQSLWQLLYLSFTHS